MSAPPRGGEDRAGPAAPAEATPLPVVMARLALELEALHGQSGAIQDVVSRLLQRASPGPGLVGEMQALDALATLAGRLASAASPAGRIDMESATEGMRLGRLRSRLLGGGAADHVAGDAELF